MISITAVYNENRERRYTYQIYGKNGKYIRHKRRFYISAETARNAGEKHEKELRAKG